MHAERPELRPPGSTYCSREERYDKNHFVNTTFFNGVDFISYFECDTLLNAFAKQRIIYQLLADDSRKGQKSRRKIFAGPGPTWIGQVLTGTFWRVPWESTSAAESWPRKVVRFTTMQRLTLRSRRRHMRVLNVLPNSASLLPQPTWLPPTFFFFSFLIGFGLFSITDPRDRSFVSS